MKKVLFASRYLQVVLLIILSLCCYVQPSCATSPKSVDLVYDTGEGTLSVKIDHYTVSAGMHHVELVEIKKNGVSVGKNEYKSQPTDSIFTYSYKITAVKGDVIEVTASCNLWGRKTASLTIP